MMNFCTLFDSYYIHKGIAMYLSLEKVTDDFTLYVMAFDNETYEKLESIGFQHMIVERLQDFETPELLSVKPTRNKAEYCWTCSPSVTWYFLEKYNLTDITYLDSDLYFMNDPKIIVDEIGDMAIAVTEHNNIDSSASGRFCVQYMYFKNNDEGCKALKWWRDKCIEWCFARYEDGKYGDQAYIESFPIRYKSLCIVQNRGAGIAPWNVMQYSYTDKTLRFNDREDEFIFFHMHGIRTDIKNGFFLMDCHDCIVTDVTERLFYIPYAKIIQDVYAKYLGIKSEGIIIKQRSKIGILWSMIRKPFRHNPIAQLLYYNLLCRRYNGKENKKL